MFTDHDLEQGVVLGVGVCEYAPVPLRPLSIPSSIYDFVEHEAGPEDLRVDGTRFGDPSSTIRALGSCQWMLGDLEKLCSFLGPPDFRSNEETLEEKARFQLARGSQGSAQKQHASTHEPEIRLPFGKDALLRPQKVHR